MGRVLEAARVGAYVRVGPEAAARTVRVVAEGDSWFSYFPSHDILANLRSKTWNGWAYKVEDRAKAGALLNDMVYGRDMVDTYELLSRHDPDVFLFSGGGNDIAGPELFVMLYHKKALELNNQLPHINASIIAGLVDEVFGQAYQDLIGLLRFKLQQIGKPDLPIIFHGYAHAIPDGRGWGGGFGPLPGPWLDPSLSRKGYDRKADKLVREVIVRQLIDAFNAMLAGIAARNANTHYVDLRPLLGRNDWANELHPSKAGFLKVTQAIEARIRQVV
jgi:hypothetical protein